MWHCQCVCMGVCGCVWVCARARGGWMRACGLACAETGLGTRAHTHTHTHLECQPSASIQASTRGSVKSAVVRLHTTTARLGKATTFGRVRRYHHIIRKWTRRQGSSSWLVGSRTKLTHVTRLFIHTVNNLALTAVLQNKAKPDYKTRHWNLITITYKLTKSSLNIKAPHQVYL